MFKKMSLVLAAALLAAPVYAGKLAVSNDPSGSVIIPSSLLDALRNQRGGLVYTAGGPTIANLVALALRLLPGGSVEGQPGAAADSPQGRVVKINGIDVVDSNGNRITCDIEMDRVTGEVRIKKTG